MMPKRLCGGQMKAMDGTAAGCPAGAGTLTRLDEFRAARSHKPELCVGRMRSWIPQATRVGSGNACEQQRRDPGLLGRGGARHGGAFGHISIAVPARDARGADPVGSSA
jgi:hypothetical protein